MSPNEFKNYKKQDFEKALTKRCEKEGLTLKVINGAECMRYGVDPNSNTIFLINNEVFALHNNGNSIRWDFIGTIN